MAPVEPTAPVAEDVWQQPGAHPWIRAREHQHLVGQQKRLLCVEVEVDTLEQLDTVLSFAAGVVDIILLDNMPPEMMVEAVRRRDDRRPSVELEASGGISEATIQAVAQSGVDRISVGALTHSVQNLDLGFDL